MMYLSFALGMLAMLAVILIIVIVVGFVKVVKLRKDVDGMSRDLDLYKNYVEEKIKNEVSELQNSIQTIYRDMEHVSDYKLKEANAYTDKRIDKLNNK